MRWAGLPRGGLTWWRPHLPAPPPAEAKSPGSGVTWTIGKAAPGATRRGDERRVAGGGWGPPAAPGESRQPRPAPGDQVSQAPWPRGWREVARLAPGCSCSLALIPTG